MKTIFFCLLFSVIIYGQEIYVGGLDLELNMPIENVIAKIGIITSNSYTFDKDSTNISIKNDGESVGSLLFTNKKLTMVWKDWGSFTEVVPAFSSLYDILESYNVRTIEITLDKSIEPNSKHKSISYLLDEKRSIIVWIFKSNIQIVEILGE